MMCCRTTVVNDLVLKQQAKRCGLGRHVRVSIDSMKSKASSQGTKTEDTQIDNLVTYVRRLLLQLHNYQGSSIFLPIILGVEQRIDLINQTLVQPA